MLGYLLRLLAGADQPHHGVVERRVGPAYTLGCGLPSRRHSLDGR
jgi:hypothetical protein